ncbi:MAG: hypothetical protein ACFE9Z_15590 [Promethearchaeota archaeon]
MFKKKKINKVISFFCFLFLIFYFISDVYAASGCGNFPGTYSFTNDDIESDPDDWTIDETGGTINVIESEESHHMVVEFNDTTTLYTIMEQSITPTIAGTIEFWVRAKQTNHGFSIRLSDGGGSNNYLNIALGDGGDFNYFDGLVKDLPIPTSYSADSWIHIRLDFNCTEGEYEIFIDGVFKGICGFYGTPIEMDHFRFSSQSLSTGVNYIDAIGYSWDPDYNIGDNLIEVCGSTIPGYSPLIICTILSIISIGFYLKKKIK